MHGNSKMQLRGLSAGSFTVLSSVSFTTSEPSQWRYFTTSRTCFFKREEDRVFVTGINHDTYLPRVLQVKPFSRFGELLPTVDVCHSSLTVQYQERMKTNHVPCDKFEFEIYYSFLIIGRDVINTCVDLYPLNLKCRTRTIKLYCALTSQTHLS